MGDDNRRDLTDAERQSVSYAFRHPRGRYVADRASQLSGVPKSTVYDWRRKRVFVPDFNEASPVAWSFRDLVLLRLMAWLRQGGMPRPTAADKVRSVKDQPSNGVDVRLIHATKTDVVLESADNRPVHDDRENLLPSSDFYGLLGTFDLHEPIDELRRAGDRSIWAPDLVTPSAHSFISPWVMAGDPCIDRTRIPTSSLYALRTERSLPTLAILKLYPDLTPEAVDDAIELESRLNADGIARTAA